MSGTRLGYVLKWLCPETLGEEDLTVLNPYQIDLVAFSKGVFI
jgi:hypothetical protein